MHAKKRIGRASVLAVMATVGGWQLAALKTAAGGTSGSNGFANVSAFLDHLATMLIFLAIPAGVLGLIAAGGMMIAGNPDGQTWLVRTIFGVALIFLAKGVMA
jgi:hypothetical protein